MATTFAAITASVFSALTMRSSRSVPNPRTAIIITPEPAPKYPPYTPVSVAQTVVSGDMCTRSGAPSPRLARAVG